ncbi:MAG TPA: UDP-N-acetylmuramoyl-L-alanine--D-glutamate ligase [Papillibacter sp.]|nr:UDP-N-acetylmuramoyl-L-alanine--D-glutamate ligase [Papillibacter sp.]
MKLTDYLKGLDGKRIAVLGVGVSNTPLIELLLKAGHDVVACDRSERTSLGERAEHLESLGAKLRLGEDYLKDLDADVIFRTPGIRPDLPEIAEAVSRGAVLTSEMEAFFEVCPCPIIAVTGSDGKTTTTTIISEFLRAAGYTAHIGGNIGTPLLDRAEEMKPSDMAVLELSSFQLMTMKKSPHIAVVTNISPNHLDVHRDMEEYVEAKSNILRYQSAGDIAAVNADCKTARSFAEGARGKVRLFSQNGPVQDGIFTDGETIFEAVDGKIGPVMPVSKIRLPGRHNVENYLAAITAVSGLVPYKVMASVAETFGGVAHRIEFVRELRGVKYYNDSIASSPSRTIAGLRAFNRKVILIAGGKDKGIDYDAIGPEIVRHVKTLVLTGMTAGKIRTAVEKVREYTDSPEIIEKEDFREAVIAAYRAAREGDIVVLSPASTSFDRFRNFEERGNVFKQIVNELE